MNKNKQAKLKKLLEKVDSLEKGSLGTSDVDAMASDLIEEELAAITAKIKGNPTIKTLQAFKSEIAKFKTSFDLKPIVQLIKDLQTEIEASEKNLLIEFEERLKQIKISPDLTDRINALQKELDNRLKAITIKDYAEDLANIRTQIQVLVDNDLTANENLKKELQTNFVTEIDKLRKELLNQVSRGGSMNRDTRVNGTNVLSRYTDINFLDSSTIGWTTSEDRTTGRVNFVASILTNVGGGGGSAFGVIAVSGQNNVVASVASDTLTFIAGTNVTLTTDANNKTVTITAAGGGSVTGISRTTSIITANTTGGTTAGVDYMYFANAGMTFTLPTAISNLNQYTLKNMAVTSVLVATSAGQTIDGSNTALITNQYQTLNFISNGSVWGVI